jgi:adenosylcobinamide kinase/adenosylcobinamide-phosphate guanylyltransferase
MKTLFIGGIKSGKSFNAEIYTLNLSKTKPLYLATTEFVDEGMQLRIKEHKEQRKEKFLTVEEPLHLFKQISSSQETFLVECLSMWINNMMYHNFSFQMMQEELSKLLKLPNNIVFVLNDVGAGIIPENKLAREFIDISGKLSQLVASECDEVYHTIAGISTRIK